MRPVGNELVSTELHRDVQPLPVKANASVLIASKIKFLRQLLARDILKAMHDFSVLVRNRKKRPINRDLASLSMSKACIHCSESLEFPLVFICGISLRSYITPCLTAHISADGRH